MITVRPLLGPFITGTGANQYHAVILENGWVMISGKNATKAVAKGQLVSTSAGNPQFVYAGTTAHGAANPTLVPDTTTRAALVALIETAQNLSSIISNTNVEGVTFTGV